MYNLNKWLEIRFKQLTKYYIDRCRKSAKSFQMVLILNLGFQDIHKTSSGLLWITGKVGLRNINCLFYILLEYDVLMQALNNKLNGIYGHGMWWWKNGNKLLALWRKPEMKWSHHYMWYLQEILRREKRWSPVIWLVRCFLTIGEKETWENWRKSFLFLQVDTLYAR